MERRVARCVNRGAEGDWRLLGVEVWEGEGRLEMKLGRGGWEVREVVRSVVRGRGLWVRRRSLECGGSARGVDGNVSGCMASVHPVRDRPAVSY